MLSSTVIPFSMPVREMPILAGPNRARVALEDSQKEMHSPKTVFPHSFLWGSGEL